MGKLQIATVVVLSFIATPALTANTSKVAPVPAIGTAVADFTAKDFLGKTYRLSEVGNGKIVVLAFVGVECPLAKLYTPRLVELAKKYQSHGVVFLGVDSNRQDAATEIAAYVRIHNVNFPVLKDLRQKIADLVGATRTPQVVVLDAKRMIRYRGRIDDQFGVVPNNPTANYQKAKPVKNDLAAALDDILADRQVSQQETAACGCLLGRDHEPAANAAVTYTKDVAAILNKNCVFCHRPGQIAPFALTNFEEAAGWSDMIAEVTQARRMPPWHADPQFGAFSNDCRLSEANKQILAKWAESGAPEGNTKDLPEPPKFVEGWLIPKPDEILSMPKPFNIPATGVVEYQNFVIDTGWKEDRWITAIEPKPGNPAVVHHILIFVKSPEGGALGLGSDNDFIGAFAPGLRPVPLPRGLARLVKAGSKLIFQMHYTPNGSPQQDLSSVGIKFADPKSVEKEVRVSSAFNAVFQIPPGESNHEARSRYVFKRDSILLSLMPHMHLRGKDFRYEATYPNGQREILLNVPRYDFGWQTSYRLAAPEQMPQGTVLNCVAHFDNSEENLNNPDPKKEVTFGDQTFDEMMIGFFESTPAAEDIGHAVPAKELSRVDQFDVIMRATKGEPDDNVKVAAHLALNDAEWMSRFGEIITLMAPQVDRVCVSMVEGGKLRQFLGPRPPQSREKNVPPKETISSPLPEVVADREQLAHDITLNKPTVYNDLSTEKGALFETMKQRGARSSLHVPVTVGGKKMTVNFWSRDPRAFPPSAVELLGALAHAMAAPHGASETPTKR